MIIINEGEERKEMSFEELLNECGMREENIEKIYHGLDEHCRCGCGGRYFYKNISLDKVGFNRALNAMKKKDFMTINIEARKFGKNNDEMYINIPEYDKDNKCYCIYFKTNLISVN